MDIQELHDSVADVHESDKDDGENTPRTHTTEPGAEPDFTAAELDDIQAMIDDDQSILNERSPEEPVSSLMSSLMGEESEDEADFHDVRPEVKQLLLDYDACGIKYPELRGPDSFSAADISFHAALVTPTTAQEDWRLTTEWLEEMFEKKKTGSFAAEVARAISIWQANKPIMIKSGGKILPKGAAPICEALAKLHGKEEDAHTGCKNSRFLGQQNNGTPVLGCSVHFNLPEFNTVRLTGVVQCLCTGLIADGKEYPRDQDTWIEFWLSPKREIMVRYIIVAWVYQSQMMAAKLGREGVAPPRSSTKKQQGVLAGSFAAPAATETPEGPRQATLPWASKPKETRAPSKEGRQSNGPRSTRGNPPPPERMRARRRSPDRSRGRSPPRSRMRTHSPSPPRNRSTGDVLRGITRNDLENLLARAGRR